MMADRRAFLAASAAAVLNPASARGEESAAILAWPDELIDIGAVAPGDWITARLAGQPVFLRRRTAGQIAAARATPMAELIDPETDEARAGGSGEWLVVSGVCTHAGCETQCGLGPYEGWQCLCHGSTYDLSGRVRQGPARRNLPVIPHRIRQGAMILQPSRGGA